MSYQETIDMELIRTWVKADRGLITETAKELRRSQPWVSMVVSGRYHSVQVTEKIMEKIVERQTRMIGYMAKIKQNAEIINQMQFQ
jgi:hypothetical protein